MMDGTLQMTTSSIPLHENKSTEFEDEMSAECIHIYSKRRTLIATDISCCTPASVASGSDKYSHRVFPKDEFSTSKDTTILK
jgi:mannose/fructose-specific phosphotransferase system component IIA